MSFILSAGVITPPLTAGGIAYGNGAQALMNPAGTTGQVLTSAGAGIPTWSNVPANVSSFSAGSTGLTPASATTGAVTLAGTLAAGNGGTGLTSPGTTGNILTSDGTGWTSAPPASAGGITLGTPTVLSSQSAVNYTGLPSSIKTIEINFYRVGFSAADSIGVRIGTAGGLATTGYNGTTMTIISGSPYTSSDYGDTYFIIYLNYTNPQLTGTMFINLVDATNYLWTAAAITANPGTNNKAQHSTSSKTLTGTLTQLSIFPVNGNTFANGTINISYGT